MGVLLRYTQIVTHSDTKEQKKEWPEKQIKSSVHHWHIQQHKGQKWYLEFHLCIQGLLPLLHKTQTEGLEVDLMFCLFDDLPQQSP